MEYKSTTAQKTIHIICLGNLWQGDDGFGIHVCRELKNRSLPAFVKVFDGGIMGFGALNYFENCHKALVIDALDWTEREGQVHRIEIDRIDESEDWPGKELLSSHILDVNYLLQILPIVFEGRPSPKIIILGAEAKVTGQFTDRLSPPLKEAIGKVIELIERELPGGKNYEQRSC